MGERDTCQYLGVGEEIVTLSSTVAPGATGTLVSTTQLENMGLGSQVYVVDGAG